MIAVSLAVTIALYLPLGNKLLAALIGAQTFCCVFLIGVCISVAVNLFTEKTELYDILVTAVFADIIIAVLQNDIFPVSYGVFHAFTTAALCLILFFFFRLPAKQWPEYVKKGDVITKPKRLFAGVFFLIGISCILSLFGNAVSESVPHGVTIFSLSTALGGVIVFLIWKLLGVSPIKCGKVLIALGAVGFLFAVAGSQHEGFLYVACVLLGCGNLACCLSAFFGIALADRYPSRFITPTIIILAVVTVVIHTALLEALRDNVSMLYIIYAIPALIACVAYLILEPHLIWSAWREDIHMPESTDKGEDTGSEAPAASDSLVTLEAILTPHADGTLSGQELRIAGLILNGYTGTEIAAMLKISENTVKGYRKNLYAKLNIHSMKELFMLTGSGLKQVTAVKK